MPDFYTVSYEYQGRLKEEKVYAEDATKALTKLRDKLRLTEPLFIHTFMVKEVKRTYVTPAERA